MKNNQIKCPKCEAVFEIDQTSFSDIVSQVRNAEFDASLEREKQKIQELARAHLEKEKAQLESELKSVRASIESERQLAVLQMREKAAVEYSKLQGEKALLENKLESVVINKDLEKKALEEKLKHEHDIILRHKDEELLRVKENKARLNTKNLGESLEKYCEMEFEKNRSMAFQNATFTKDNTALKGDDGDVSGSKGDYIFREVDESGAEIISIMFEMKNQEDEAATRKTNEAFLEKLHKDREKKKCEYAVLVSLLEPDSELYNGGIVDKSHKHQKMFVIRPQFFLSIISLLRNAALSSLKEKRELQRVKVEQVDIVKFQEQLDDFKAGFGKNYELASKHFSRAIEEIDKSIARLVATKEALLGSDRQFRIANDKVDNMTIEKLAKNSPKILSEIKESKKSKKS